MNNDNIDYLQQDPGELSIVGDIRVHVQWSFSHDAIESTWKTCQATGKRNTFLRYVETGWLNTLDDRTFSV